MPRKRVTEPGTARGGQLDTAHHAYTQATTQAMDDYRAACTTAWDDYRARMDGYTAEYHATVERIRAGDGAALKDPDQAQLVYDTLRLSP